jgi:Flp pilus assembly protein TadG
MRTRFLKNQRGAALLETAVTIPIILLISVAIFEFGRAYQTWQVLTNAAREGARVAIISGTTDAAIRTTVQNYMAAGGLDKYQPTMVDVQRSVTLGATTASQITINYPFDFIVLNPVARLIAPDTKTGESLIMSTTAIMRNEN